MELKHLRADLSLQNQEGLSLNEAQHQTQHFNMRCIEQWLDTALLEADTEHKLPNNVTSFDTNRWKALQNYRIDRRSLQLAGIPNKAIDSLYRALYVNVTACFKAIDTCVRENTLEDPKSRLGPHLNRGSLIQSLWRVYAILMECAYRNNYRMQVLTVQDDFKADYQSEILSKTKVIDQRETKILDLTKEIETLKTKLAKEERAVKEIQCLMLDKDSIIRDQEIRWQRGEAFRLAFEAKVNNLYSLSRVQASAAAEYRDKYVAATDRIE